MGISRAKRLQNISDEQMRKNCSKAGRISHAKGTAHEWTSETARLAGIKGGKASAAARRKKKAARHAPAAPAAAPATPAAAPTPEAPAPETGNFI